MMEEGGTDELSPEEYSSVTAAMNKIQSLRRELIEENLREKSIETQLYVSARLLSPSAILRPKEFSFEIFWARVCFLTSVFG